MKKFLAPLIALFLATKLLAADPVPLHFLDNAPPSASAGISWGVPWPRGAVQKTQTFSLKSADKTLPLQSWPLAYWPDGSIKWTGFATIADPSLTAPLQLSAAARPAGGPVKVIAGDTITIDTGRYTARIPKSGQYLFDAITVDGREVARHGTLECILQNAPDGDLLTLPAREAFSTNIKTVTVEQSGPVRAVVKLEGTHKSTKGAREWLPFTVRLYFYGGDTPIRLVTTTIFDGDQDKDFIKGLGIRFDVPMREQSQNRHVRFANSNGGVWAEPLQLGTVTSGRAGAARGGGQLDGGRVPNSNQPPASAEWSDFKLLQLSSEGFTLAKRTNPKSSWVGINEGKRAAGLAFIGDVSGGLAVGIKNFWQSYPASLEIQNGLSDTAQIHAWLWSPDADAMDLRHYDTHGHGNVNTGGSYEDYEPEFATPEGVARTSELLLYPTGDTPTREKTAQLAQLNQQPPLLAVTPEYMHSTGVFGIWSVQDRSTPFKKEVEDRLDGAIDFYKNAIDENHWYGYWNFGDVRHAYDAARHEWRYDVGGYAWDNSELGSVLWLWTSYIRTGNADTYRMAEAMIRHTSEVDTHHIGRFAGLGSRHNVSHWGDSAKEARVSQSAHAMFYYYLSTDERTGDIMHQESSVDEVASKLDPMRKAKPITEAEKKYPGRIRIGPDWLGFAGNWMVEWERTGDKKWRDKIMAGVESLYEMPFWMRTGDRLVVGYDYNTGKMFPLDSTPGTYNLTTIQGGAEVAFELTDLLNDDKWTKMWLQYCRLGSANAATLTRDKETGNEGAAANMMGEQGGSSSQGTPRLAAYAYYKTRNPAFAQFAIRALTAATPNYTPTLVQGPDALSPLHEAPGITAGGTNSVAQNSLTAIEILELCKDQLPAEAPPPGGARGGRAGG
jgi:hypothetical protein